jgi:hypothetical protein
MKVRNGFVSNSSSSSFIVACREELCECQLKKALKINHPLGFVMEAVAHFIEMNAQSTDLSRWEKDTYQKPPDIVKELCEVFPHVYTFEADSHEGGEVGRMLYQHAKDFGVDTDDVVIRCLWETD